MNPISLSMDLLLMVLLIAALGFGWRLERRLRGLRESHVDFANAIADLDRAAQRSEAALAQLRQGADEAFDLLAGRIEKARELTTKLEKLTADAALIAQRPANDAPRSPMGRVSPHPAAAARPSPVSAVLAAESLARRLSQDDSLVPRIPAPAAMPASARPAAARSAPQPTPRSATRARPMADDDLFETSPRAAQAGAMGGRR